MLLIHPHLIQAKRRRLANAVSRLGPGCRRWTNLKRTLGERLLFAGLLINHLHSSNIEMLRLPDVNGLSVWFNAVVLHGLNCVIMDTSKLAITICMTIMTIICFLEAFDSCDKHFSLRDPEMAALINRTYPSCDQRNLSAELPICQIDGENTVDTCYAPPGRLPALPACPDGTWNRTCYPRTSVNMIYMNCVCHSVVQVTENIRETHFENWQKLDPPVNGAYYRRRLMMDTECIGQELVKIFLNPIVKAHSLLDSVYTSSSFYENGHEAHRARIDNYLTACCGWASGPGDLSNPWLAITLPTEYLIKGMMIKKRCDPPKTDQYVTKVTVTTSHDDVTYQDVVAREDLSAGYDADITAYIVFTQVYTTRFWLIQVNAYNVYPAMKCDLLCIK